MMGSHIDSVQTAGRFDGCLGVLGGLEVVRTLDDHGIRTRRPLMVAFFTDEEGARFGTDMLGKRGRHRTHRARGRVRVDGRRTALSVRGELEKIGFLGDGERAGSTPPYAYLECHIEQGPILRAKNLDIGVVTGVQAISWHELAIVGQERPRRHDAHGAARRSRRGGGADQPAAPRDDRVGPLRRRTARHDGRHRGAPGPGQRGPGEVACNGGSAQPRRRAHAARPRPTSSRSTPRSPEREHVKHHVAPDRAHGDGARSTEGARRASPPSPAPAGSRTSRIVSGAGHDAQEMARICRAGMVFVPGEHDGISHNPRELSTREQCDNGVNVLFDVALCIRQRRTMTSDIRVAPDRDGERLSRHAGPASRSWARLADKLEAIRTRQRRAPRRADARRAGTQGARVIGFGELFTGPYFALGRDPMWLDLAEDAAAGPDRHRARARREASSAWSSSRPSTSARVKGGTSTPRS